MYPLKFENLYYEKIWGGRGLESFRDNLPEGNIGESWDIACHENGMSIILNGDLKGKFLQEAIYMYKEELLGTGVSVEKFPLLVKLISSNQNLSLQVHPDDIYAKDNEKSLGKTEMWYVIEAEEDAKLIVGTKKCDKETFKRAIEENTVLNYVNEIKVKEGDCFLINSGTVHAICKGVIIAEIQQNSDITYRIYDYGRPRELHIEKSLDVINFDLQVKNLSEEISNEYNKSITLCKNKYFTVDKYNINDYIIEYSNTRKFYIFTCVEGNGVIKYDSGEEKIYKGDSILIPAFLGKYKLEGNFTLLKTYV